MSALLIIAAHDLRDRLDLLRREELADVDGGLLEVAVVVADFDAEPGDRPNQRHLFLMPALVLSCGGLDQLWQLLHQGGGPLDGGGGLLLAQVSVERGLVPVVARWVLAPYKNPIAAPEEVPDADATEVDMLGGPTG